MGGRKISNFDPERNFEYLCTFAWRSNDLSIMHQHNYLVRGYLKIHCGGKGHRNTRRGGGGRGGPHGRRFLLPLCHRSFANPPLVVRRPAPPSPSSKTLEGVCTPPPPQCPLNITPPTPSATIPPNSRLQDRQPIVVGTHR